VIRPPVSGDPWEPDPGTIQAPADRGDAAGVPIRDFDGSALPLSLSQSSVPSPHSITEAPESDRLLTHMRICAKLMLQKPG
jgi:hypothetical protein